jgi:hypothetical protein
VLCLFVFVCLFACFLVCFVVIFHIPFNRPDKEEHFSLALGGRLTQFLNQWENITIYMLVLTVIRGGQDLQFSTIQRKLFINCRLEYPVTDL